MTENVLTFKNVSFSYGSKPVLDNLSFDIPKASVTALMGPSGCGKSTILSIASDLLSPNAGSLSRTCKRPSILFQDPALLPWRTALANVAFALKADKLTNTQRRQKAEAILLSLGLEASDLEKYPRQLSGGMRQRVALARALVIEPDFLFLDEPFSALDVGLRRQMLNRVREEVEQRGISALVVTHDTLDAVRIAEKVILLSQNPAHILKTFALESNDEKQFDLKAAEDIEMLLTRAENTQNAH